MEVINTKIIENGKEIVERHREENRAYWINSSERLFTPLEIAKPCFTLDLCPYGSIVEYYPLDREEGYSCKLFGHDCPIFYQAEKVTEDMKP